MVKCGLSDSLANLGVDYLDLYVMSSPMAFKENCGTSVFPREKYGNIEFSDVSYLETYKSMEEFVKNGKVRSLGVSNFNISQLKNLMKNCEIKPVANVIECHPYFQNDKLVEFCQSNSIMVIAYAPL